MLTEELCARRSAIEGGGAQRRLLNKYASGVILTGSVKDVIEEEDKSLHVWLGAAGGKWIALSFADKGATAKTKTLKAGSAVKASCAKVLGSADRYIMVGDCALD